MTEEGARAPTGIFQQYEPGAFFDEMFEPSGQPRAACAELARRFEHLTRDDLLLRQAAAEHALLQTGITFNVYGHQAGAEKIFPFDILPRVVAAREWAHLERGLEQRIRALNLFIHDLYHRQDILSDGVVPRDLVESSKGFLPACVGLEPPQGVWCHVAGIDLVRGADGVYRVLEDNLRCPSGVSYVLQNRTIMKRMLPGAFAAARVRPVDMYPARLLEALSDVRPKGVDAPTVVLLSPGAFNSAYFEHSFLAQQMGIDLVEGRDLLVRRGSVYARTTRGLRRVDVIYRRIDDTFLDPDAFRPDSLLGVPGLMDAYRRGNVTLANAPGTGVADDKVVYAYVPQIIEYYLARRPSSPTSPPRSAGILSSSTTCSRTSNSSW